MELPLYYDKLNWSERRLCREAYILKQKGLCYHCNTDLNTEPEQDKVINTKLFPDNFFNNPIHLHHNHDTGLTIGAVHAYCNAVLWQYHGE